MASHAWTAERTAALAADFRASIALCDADHPAFRHAPMIGRWSMIAYGGGQPLEYCFGSKRTTPADAEVFARDEAFCSMRRRVVVRSPDGEITYNGPALIALGGAA